MPSGGKNHSPLTERTTAALAAVAIASSLGDEVVSKTAAVADPEIMATLCFAFLRRALLA